MFWWYTTQYIVAGSPLEVNIPARMRDAITPALSNFETIVQNAPHENGSIDLPLQNLADGFRHAFDEIRRLLARDAWPRFRRSRYWQVYSSLIDLDARLTSAVLEMVEGHGGAVSALEQDDNSEGSSEEKDGLVFT